MGTIDRRRNDRSRRETGISRAGRATRARLTLLAPLALTLSLSAQAGEPWPVAVQARYDLRYNGFNVGHLDVNSSTTAKTYSVSGSGKVSAFFGLVTWSGNSSVSGAIVGGAPQPSTYAFHWRNNRKSGDIRIGYKDRVAADVSVTPPPEPHKDLVPLVPAHMAGAPDPVSALLLLTKADGKPPCERRVEIFDGKQRYAIVLTPKRLAELPSAAKGGPPDKAHVCRAMYEPIAGHRDNKDTKTYMSNREVEVVMRRIPGTDMVIPYSVSVPTAWGTGTMVTNRVEVTTAASGKIALGP